VQGTSEPFSLQSNKKQPRWVLKLCGTATPRTMARAAASGEFRAVAACTKLLFGTLKANSGLKQAAAWVDPMPHQPCLLLLLLLPEEGGWGDKLDSKGF
jgi:hypothetical protein